MGLILLLQQSSRRIFCDGVRHFQVWDEVVKHFTKWKISSCSALTTDHVHKIGEITDHPSTCKTWRTEHRHKWPAYIPYGKGFDYDPRRTNG